MKKIFRVINIFLILFSVILLLLIGYYLGKNYDIAIDENDDYIAVSYSVNEQKMRRLMSLIEHQYVDEIDKNSLVDGAISYVMSNLDPHSSYTPKEISRKEESENSGEFQGIGIEYFVNKDTTVITKILSSSPNKAQLFFGDRILAVNNLPTLQATADSVASYIQNDRKNSITLKIKRGKKILEVQVKKGLIISPSIADYYMVNKEIGYIKLNRFVKSSYEEFHTALLSLKKKGMRSLIFDLRGNPGGVMAIAEKITDEFLEEDKLIVFTQDRQGKKSFRYATSDGDFEGKPLYILVDESSASASEIVAGAIQDQDAGIIIGRRTYGKGLVQKEINLGDDSKVKMTVAHYYTPTGRSIQKPYNLDVKEYNKDLSNRFLRGEFFSLDSIKKIDTLKYKTPKGKVVYGGGGIIPDVFVPLDTLRLKHLARLRDYEGKLNSFIFSKIDANLNEFRKIKKEHFILFYNVDRLVNEFEEEMKKEGEYVPEKNKRLLSNYMKAKMAYYLYDDEAYYRILREQDEIIKKAYKIASGLE